MGKGRGRGGGGGNWTSGKMLQADAVALGNVGAAEMAVTPSHAPCRKCNKYLNCLMLFTFTPTFRFTPTFTFRFTFTFVIAFAFAAAPAGPIVHRFMQISA